MQNNPDGKTVYKKPKRKLVLIIVLVIVAVLVAVFFAGAAYFKTHFFPHTTVGNADMSMKTQGDLDDYLDDLGGDYVLTITDRDGNSDSISGGEIDYASNPSENMRHLVSRQNSVQWLANLNKSHAYEIDSSFTYDESKLESAISNLDFMQPENMVAPEDASVELTEDGYRVKEETQGSTVLTDEVTEKIKDAVKKGEETLTLTDDDYEKPAITTTSAEITNVTDKVDSFTKSTVTYKIDNAEEVLDKDKILTFLNIDPEAGTVTLNEDKVSDYVDTLARTYNTYGDERQFKTTAGDTITIGGGDYGWVVSKSGEKEQLMKDLQGGQPVEREPVWEQTAVQRNVNGDQIDDIGNTYIEIDYTNQHLYYYKDGQLQMDTDIVSGNISVGNGSPDGIFKISYKQSPATLVGENYESHVTYFMVFSYNVGIHDADWRGRFGGQIYKSSGSHGCINVAKSFASKLYGVLEEKTPVVAYYRDSVSLTSENARIANAYSYKG